MAHLSWILLWFEAISWLNNNLEKGSIMQVGNVEDPSATELGCRMGNLPTTYLGLPLGMCCKGEESLSSKAPFPTSISTLCFYSTYLRE